MTAESTSTADFSKASITPLKTSQNTDNIELRKIINVEKATESEPNIPRADGGKHAWAFLAGCFVFEALIWGFPFSFGVFQSFYTTHPPFAEHPNGIAVIGTCSTGIMYLFAPISLYALEAWPSIRRLSSVVGLVIVVSALIASSFSTQIWHLILTQGVLYAIGGSLLYSPTMFYLDEWFIKKKGLAFGIMWAGVGTSGLLFPFLLTHLLKRYAFRTTLRIWSLTLLTLCTPLIYFIKPRLPASSPSTPRKKPTYTFLTTRPFILLQLSNIIESLGFFLPLIYLPSYTTSLTSSSTSHAHDLPQITPTLLLALLNASSVLGAITFGFLCDHLPVTTVILISSVGSTLSTLIFWGLGTTLPMLVVFAVTYGVFAGGFSAIWTGMMGCVQESERGRGREVGMGVLMGVWSAGRGVGAVVSGPVSEVLLGGREVGMGMGGMGAYGGVYAAVVVFTGVSAAVGGVVCLGLGFRGGLEGRRA